MRNSGLSSRVLFVLTAAVTVLLLLGSVVMQRWVFKAESATASLFLTPTQFNVTPESQVRLGITADIIGYAQITGAQISLQFPANLLKFTTIEDPAMWTTVKVENVGNNLMWTLVPAAASTLDLTGRALLGTLVFEALAEGEVQLNFDQQQTILAAYDSKGETPVYNALGSIQDGIGTISKTTAAPTQFSTLAQSTNGEQSVSQQAFTNQRFTSTQVITYPTSAVLMARLQYLGKLTVNFGPTEALGQAIHLTALGTDHLVKLNGLTPGSTTFYQLVAEDTNGGNKLVGALKSFLTPQFGSSPVDLANSSVVVFPNPTKNQATLYILLRDKDKGVINDLQPTLTLVSGKATLSQITEIDGEYSSTVTSLATTKQTVVVSASIDGQLVKTVQIAIDPTITEQAGPAEEQMTKLHLSLSNVGVLVILLLGLSACLFGFWRLSKAK